ncbi:MAG: hypothetical protein JMDDDDMK_00697 [Acidobacteria bacterium]|nr:hypothetical protein [Acidobacteriota bacterium]
MSLKFEIADWRFEVTLDGLLCQPLERGRAKTARKPAAQPNRRDIANAGKANSHSPALAVQTFNRHTQRKGATK